MFALNQFANFQRLYLESAQEIAVASFTGLEKLAQLNVQAAKASVEESVQRRMALLGTQDVKALAETSTALAPSGDKFIAYSKHVYGIANETGAEISKVVEKQFSESNRQFMASMEAMTKNSPAGAEGVAGLVKSTITAVNANWDQVNKAGRQVVEMTEANATSVARTAGRHKTA